MMHTASRSTVTQCSEEAIQVIEHRLKGQILAYIKHFSKSEKS